MQTLNFSLIGDIKMRHILVGFVITLAIALTGCSDAADEAAALQLKRQQLELQAAQQRLDHERAQQELMLERERLQNDALEQQVDNQQQYNGGSAPVVVQGGDEIGMGTVLAGAAAAGALGYMAGSSNDRDRSYNTYNNRSYNQSRPNAAYNKPLASAVAPKVAPVVRKPVVVKPKPAVNTVKPKPVLFSKPKAPAYSKPSTSFRSSSSSSFRSSSSRRR